MKINVRIVIKVLALLCIIIFFLPTFCVSCSGKSIEISGRAAVEGIDIGTDVDMIDNYTKDLGKPHYIVYLALAIPIAILIVMFIKSASEKATGLIVLICGIGDVILWLSFMDEVKDTAQKYYCTFDTTGWYYLNMASLVVITILSFLVFTNVFSMDGDLKTHMKTVSAQGVVRQVSGTVMDMSNNVTPNVKTPPNMDIMGYCSGCGNALEYGDKFCVSCGTVVPQSMLDEAEMRKKEEERRREEELARRREDERRRQEAARRREEERMRREAQNAMYMQDVQNSSMQGSPNNRSFCTRCGSEVSVGATFCVSCGARIEK